MSCVMKRIVESISLQTSSSHSCMSRRVCESSAPNGSSSSSTSREKTIVRISAARWRMPPESACG